MPAPSPSSAEHYLLLPVGGTQAAGLGAAASQPFFTHVYDTLTGLRGGHAWLGAPHAKGRHPRVLDSVYETGAKLVSLTPADVVRLRAEEPGVRLVRETFYSPALAPVPRVTSKAKPAAAGAAATKLKLKVVAKDDKAPLAGATVIAFTDFDEGAGAEGTTKADGTVSLALGKSSVTLDRLIVVPCGAGSWGLDRAKVKVKGGDVIEVERIDLAQPDVMRARFGLPPLDAGDGVRVGVIDTGVDRDHTDLRVSGGLNAVPDIYEPGAKEDDYGDSGAGHGTHVAGIISARGTPPSGMRGMAPGASLFSYRVFPRQKPCSQGKGASNFSILKALAQAREDDCDLINMSLGGGPLDEAVEDGMREAREGGALVIVAAGNDGRLPVSFPARSSHAVAVSAAGRRKTFPATALARGDLATPAGTDSADFLAAFSNVGVEIDLTAYGVAVVSTWPGGGHAALSGTSMACPMVAGIAARLLAGAPGVRGMSRNADRSAAIAKLLFDSTKKLGFGPTNEGQGMPLP